MAPEYFAPNCTPYAKLQICWQSSSATLEKEAPIQVTFYRIELSREDVLKLLPEGYDPLESPSATALELLSPKAAPAQVKGLKRGQKGYSEEELKPFELKFYRLLYEDDVKAGAEFCVDHYAEMLTDWGRRNRLRTPGQTKMSEQIKKWWRPWLDVLSLKE